MTVGLPSEPAGSTAPARLAAARAVRASRPGPEAEALRRAYLELLKLCLCDLGGTTTASVGAMPDGTVMARQLAGDQIRLRVVGMDWPLEGLTMVGLHRLDDLQACVESVVHDGVTGDVIEAGAWRGGASIFARAALDALGDERTVWVADSFQGFLGQDANAAGDVRLSAFDFLAVPLEEVRESFARFGCERGVEFVPGLFADTLPRLADRRWAIVRLDGDTYEATQVALRSLYPTLAVGGYLIVDDYGALEECRRAVDDFRSEHAITEPLEEVDWTGVRWRRQSETPVAAADEGIPVGEAPRGVDRASGTGRSRDAHVPTARELELAGELDAMGRSLEAARAEAARLAGSPVRVPLAWLRRRLRDAREGRRR